MSDYKQGQLYFDEDISRGRHNEFSKKAHARLGTHKVTLRQQVLAMIQQSPRGMTLYELSEAMNKPVNSISGRLTELCILKLIHVCGSRMNKYGNECSVYVAG